MLKVILLLFSVSFVCGLSVDKTFEEVVQFVAEDSSFHFSDDAEPVTRVSAPSTTLVSHSKRMLVSETGSVFKSVSLFYRSPNSLVPHDFLYIPELAAYTQIGVHVLVEYEVEQAKPNNVEHTLDELLDFYLFTHQGPCESLLSEQGAQIRSKTWLSGDQTPNNATTVEYFYKALTGEQHQYLSQHRAVSRTSKAPAALFSPFPSDQILSLHSVSFTLTRVLETFSYDVLVRENTVAALSENFSFRAAVDTVNALHSCDNKECTLSSLNRGTSGVVHTQVNRQRSFASLVSLTRTVEGPGFHKDLRTSLVIDVNDNVPSTEECEILLVERISEDFFVDQYQVDERFKFGAPTQVVLDHTIDLEKPSYQSTANVVLTKQKTPKTESGRISAEFELPIHYRYRMPKTSQLYVDGIISDPSVFIRCDSTLWEAIPQHNSKQISVQVPTGQIEHTSLVINATLIITTLGALVVLITVVKSRNK